MSFLKYDDFSCESCGNSGLRDDSFSHEFGTEQIDVDCEDCPSCPVCECALYWNAVAGEILANPDAEKFDGCPAFCSHECFAKYVKGLDGPLEKAELLVAMLADLLQHQPQDGATNEESVWFYNTAELLSDELADALDTRSTRPGGVARRLEL